MHGGLWSKTKLGLSLGYLGISLKGIYMALMKAFFSLSPIFVKFTQVSLQEKGEVLSLI